MYPSQLKFLLLVLVLFAGVGGYYYVTTSPSSDRPLVKTEPRVVRSAMPKVVNVTNVRLEKTQAGIDVSGQAKNMIDPAATFFRVTRRVESREQELVLVQAAADLRIENGQLRGGLLTASLVTSPASFQITRVSTIDNGGVIVGLLTVAGKRRAVTVPYTREGNMIAADMVVGDMRVVWRLAIK
jgi:hypothetical protein